jgi:hypothetical protein
VPEALRAAAKTFEERNRVYGNNYLNVGNVMKGLFPDGMVLKTADDFASWHLLELAVVKLTRFANSKLTHLDSIHDATVYCAMLEALVAPPKLAPTQRKRRKQK